MSAELFITKLENMGLLDERILGKLRAQISRPGKTPSAKSVAKYLIENGQLTEFQAKKLLQDAKTAQAESEFAEPEELSFADSASTPKNKPMEVEIVEVEAVDAVEEIEEIEEFQPDQEEVEVVELASTKKKSKSKKKKPPAPELVEPIDLLDDMSQMDSFNDPLAEPMGGESLDTPVEAEYIDESSSTFRGKKELGNQWDSKWVMILPAFLAILVIAGVVIYFLMFSQSADSLWEQAETSYGNQNYPAAIEEYEKFVLNFKKDPRSKIALARNRMARLRIPFEASNSEAALEAFKEHLPILTEEVAAIEDTAEKDNLRAEIASMLPANAVGFVDKADKTDNIDEAKRLLNLADENMTLVNNGAYIPGSERDKPAIQKRIKEVAESVAKVRRKVEREDKLVAGLGQIKEKSDTGDTPGAAQTYDALLREYPELRSEPRLLDAIREVTKKQQALVSVVNEELPNTTETIASDAKSVVLSTHVGNNIDVLQGEVQALLVNGAIYGIDVGLGKILWRHFVGFETTILPQWIDTGERKILAADQQKQDLICFNPADGNIVWKTTIGEPFLAPLIIEDQIFVTTRSGKIYSIESIDGLSTRFAKIPQQFDVPPAPVASTGRRRLLQVGDHTNLYVFSASDMSCKEVYYVGHQRGAIEVPPLVISGHVLIAENKPNSRCELHVLKTDDDGLLQRAQNPEILEGHVSVAMLPYGRRAFVLTDKGTVVLIEIDLSSPERPAKRIAEEKILVNNAIETQYLAQDGRLWVADLGLTRFDIQTQKGELARQHISNNHDRFVGPLHYYTNQNSLLHVRQRRDSALISVSAVDADMHKEIWRLDFAAPLTGAPFVDPKSQQLLAVNSQGDFFALNEQAIAEGIVSEPLMRASTSEQDLNFKYQVDLGGGNFAFVGPAGQKRMLAYQSKETKPLKLVDLNTGEYDLSGEPVSFDNKILVTSTNGMVQLIDPASSGLPARFMPEIKPNSQVIWQRPAIIDASTFAIAQQDGKIYTVTRQGDRLSLANSATFGGKIVRPLAAMQGHVLAVAASGREHKLVSFELPGMDARKEISVQGAVEFGPFVIDPQHAVIANDLGTIICVDSEANEVWTFDAGKTYVSGAALDGEKLVVSLLDGRVVWLNKSDGTKLNELTISEPTTPGATDPIVYEGSLYIPAADGTVHVLKSP